MEPKLVYYTIIKRVEKKRWQKIDTAKFKERRMARDTIDYESSFQSISNTKSRVASLW